MRIICVSGEFFTGIIGKNVHNPNAYEKEFLDKHPEKRLYMKFFDVGTCSMGRASRLCPLPPPTTPYHGEQSRRGIALLRNTGSSMKDNMQYLQTKGPHLAMRTLYWY